MTHDTVHHDAHAAEHHSLVGGAGNVDARLVGLIGAIGVVIFLVIILATEAWFYNQRRALFEETNYRRANLDMRAHLEQQRAMLHTPRKITVPDQPTRYTMTIDQAMQRYAESQND